MLTTLFLAISPFVVNAITGIVKNLPSFEEVRLSRKPAVRMLAGFVSLVYVAVALWLAPDTVSDSMLSTALTTFGVAFVTWLSSLGSYHAFFDKG